MRIGLSMKNEFYERIKQKAKEKGMGISEYIRYAIARLWELEKGD